MIFDVGHTILQVSEALGPGIGVGWCLELVLHTLYRLSQRCGPNLQVHLEQVLKQVLKFVGEMRREFDLNGNMR
jgi:hypothetical protein